MKRVASHAAQGLVAGAILILLGWPGGPTASAQDGEPKTFASPEQAVSALFDAAKAKDNNTILAVLGAKSKPWITSGDPVQDRLGVEAFVAAYEKKNEIEKDGDDKAILSIGDDGFPFPFPVIKSAKGWAFDPEQGKEELLDRRIGRNELTTIKVLRAVVDAQRDYAGRDYDGNGVLEYATKLRSSPGKQDGLYWPTAEGDPLSPLGPLVADAVNDGYTAKDANADGDKPRAFYGYYFKLLKRQGPDAPGGELEYVVNGKMIGGFAVLAYPARYGNSGIMTFMVSDEEMVYQSDLGPKTAEATTQIDVFNPGEGWEKVEPE